MRAAHVRSGLHRLRRSKRNCKGKVQVSGLSFLFLFFFWGGGRMCATVHRVCKCTICLPCIYTCTCVHNVILKAAGPDPSAPGCGPPTYAVSKLNARAKTVMEKHSVPMLDLNTLVHSHCGANYSNCSLCDDESKYMGIRCGYHYAPAGVEILAEAVADSFRKILGSQ